MQKDDSKNVLNEMVLQQSSLIKTENSYAFRDLNKNGKLDIYEDPRQPLEARIDDLPFDSENPLYPFGFGLSY